MRISISRRGVIVAASLAGIAVWAASSQAAPLSFKVALTDAQQVPPVQTTATGTADLTFDRATRMLTCATEQSAHREANPESRRTAAC